MLSVHIEHYSAMMWPYDVRDSFSDFNFDFVFGRSYLLDSPICKGAWALARLIAGETKQRGKWTHHGPFGTINLNGQPYSEEQRRKDAWLVHWSEMRGYWSPRTSTQAHIQRGLRTNPNPYFTHELQYFAYFDLTPERFTRSIRMLSHERWRASCAVGLAYGKRIFSFPYVEFVRPYLIAEYIDAWLKPVINILSASGALVLVPALEDSVSRRLCDEIVPIRKPAYQLPPGTPEL